MATASNFGHFPYKPTVPTDTPTAGTQQTKPKLRLVQDTGSREAEAGNISVDDLYPAPEAAAPELSVALRLLSTGLAYLREASDALRGGSDIAADSAVQQLQALLPELFNCRVLGDGYGAIINATHNSLRNIHGSPLRSEQINTIRQVLQRARSEPFIHFESALNEIEKLEQVGFVIEPPAFEYLADWLDE
jgi:hypothetical protein